MMLPSKHYRFLANGIICRKGTSTGETWDSKAAYLKAEISDQDYDPWDPTDQDCSSHPADFRWPDIGPPCLECTRTQNSRVLQSGAMQASKLLHDASLNVLDRMVICNASVQASTRSKVQYSTVLRGQLTMQ